LGHDPAFAHRRAALYLETPTLLLLLLLLLQFRPERWLEPNSSVHPETGANRFTPFGIGPKACVAQQLAYTQLKVGADSCFYFCGYFNCSLRLSSSWE
jgi:hypothetical protein